jgi:hypothetical protein
MSINLSQFVWPTNFANTIVTKNIVIPNSYQLNFSILPLEQKENNVALGFKKMKYFAEYRLMNSIFISRDNALLPALSIIENNVVVFPTEPSDYYIGAVLLSKFIAITEKYFHIEFMSIDSMVGDHVQYTLSDPEECNLDLTGKHWWNMDTTNTGSGNKTLWNDVDIIDGPSFELTVIKGGRDGS